MKNFTNNVGVAWVVLIYVYSYIIRLLIILFQPESVYWTVPVLAWPAFDDPNVKIDTIGILLLFIIAFASSLILCRPFARSRLRNSAWTSFTPVIAGRNSIVILLTASVVLAILLNALAYTYGIGRQGQFNEEQLPYKLAGMLVYGKSSLIPVLLMVQVYWAEKNGMRWLARVGVFALLAIGFSDMIMLDSRGAALKHVLLLALLWWLAGFRLRFADKLALLLFGFVLFIAIQMVTSIRLYAEQAVELSLDEILLGFNFVLFRITGVEQLMAIQYLGSPIPFGEVWDVLMSPRGVPGYYTTNLLGVDENLPQTFAPSGLGWLYLVGGLPGITAGAVVIGVAAKTGWRALDSKFSCCAPVIKSFYLLALLVIIAEGSVGPPFVSFLISAVILKTIDFFMKFYSVRNRNFIYMRESEV